MIKFMLKNHLRFISLICLLMALVQIKNTFFSSQIQGLISPIPDILNPKTATLSPLTPSDSKTLINNSSKQNDETSKSENLKETNSTEGSNKLDNSEVGQTKNQQTPITKVSPKKIVKTDPISDQKNNFQKTYQKFALLEFDKNVRKQFELDLKEMPKDYLSMGFTVDHGSIHQPKVEVKYTDGTTETLKLPFSEMFQNDWVKLNTNPNLKIESINVSAQSPVDKSIFSFFIQEHL